MLGDDVALLSPFVREHLNVVDKYNFLLPDLGEGGIRQLRDPTPTTSCPTEHLQGSVLDVVGDAAQHGHDLIAAPLGRPLNQAVVPRARAGRTQQRSGMSRGHHARMISPVRHPSTLRTKADAIVGIGTGRRPGL